MIFFVKMQEQINGKIISIRFFMKIDIKIISITYLAIVSLNIIKMKDLVYIIFHDRNPGNIFVGILSKRQLQKDILKLTDL